MGCLTASHILITAVLLFYLLEGDYSFELGPPLQCSNCKPRLITTQHGNEYLVTRAEIGAFLESQCCTCCKLVSEEEQPDSVQVRVEFTSISEAYIVTEWNMSTVASQVPVKVEQDGYTMCLCLSAAAANKVTVQLLEPPLPPHYGCLAQNNVSVTVNGLQQQVKVRDCFDTHKDTAICTPQVVAAPCNVTAATPSFSGDSVNVTIHWEPPSVRTRNANGTSIVDEYMLDIPGGADIFLLGNVTEYSLLLSDVSSLPSLVLVLHVRAGVAMKTNPCCTCLTNMNGSIVFGPRTTLNISLDTEETSRGTLTTAGVQHAVAWPIALLVVLVAAIFFAIFLRVAYVHRRDRMKEHTITLTSESLDPDTVFLAASTEEDEEVKRRIRHLCHILADHGLTPVYYEYVVNDHTADGPSALGMNRWVELQFSRCQFVLFVCTKRFLEEWNGERRDILSPLVYPCRNLLDGLLTRPQNISRFAVLFVGDDCCVPPGLLRLKRFNITRPRSEQLYSDKLMNFLISKPLLTDFVANYFKHYC